MLTRADGVARASSLALATRSRRDFPTPTRSTMRARRAPAARVTRAAETHTAEEDHDAAAEAYAAAMREAGFHGNDPSSSSSASVAAWTRSYLSFRRGASLRRAGRLDASARALR